MFQELLEKVALELTAQHIPYMVIGGQAVLLYGEPRLTRDIDITLGIGIDELERIKTIVDGIPLKPLVPDPEEFVKETMVFPVIDRKSGIRVDFIFSFSPYERQAIERARGIVLGTTEVMFGSLEDVVIHKIIAGRARDMDDIERILLKNPDHDKTYIERWLGEFDKSLDDNYTGKFRQLIERIRNLP